MKYSKYFGAKWRGFIQSKSALAPKSAIHLLTENIRYDIMFSLTLFQITTICTIFSLSLSLFLPAGSVAGLKPWTLV